MFQGTRGEEEPVAKKACVARDEHERTVVYAQSGTHCGYFSGERWRDKFAEFAADAAKVKKTKVVVFMMATSENFTVESTGSKAFSVRGPHPTEQKVQKIISKFQRKLEDSSVTDSPWMLAVFRKTENGAHYPVAFAKGLDELEELLDGEQDLHGMHFAVLKMDEIVPLASGWTGPGRPSEWVQHVDYLLTLT